MNKTYLIVGGASLVSLAAGGSAGYLLAKKKFDATVDGLIELEVQKTKKYYAVIVAELKAGKTGPITEVVTSDKPAAEDIAEGEDDEEQPELTEADKRAIEKGRQNIAKAGQALRDYQGYAKKPDLAAVANGEVVASNIFSKSAPAKKAMPPKDPATGRFLPRQKQDDEKEQTPQLIDQQTFLLNDGEYEQVNLLYFKQNDTMIDVENNNEVVENGVVGAVNLTLFPEPDEHGYSAIYVRNEWLEKDYEVRLMSEDLTAYLGMGTEDEGDDFDENDVAEHALAHGYED